MFGRKYFIYSISVLVGVLISSGSFAQASSQEEAGININDLFQLTPQNPFLQTEPLSMESAARDFVKPDDLLSAEELNQALPWSPPNYSNQSSALGWSENVFEIPKGLENRVAFWNEIYTKLSTDQGLLHDRDNIEIVYERFDFSAIMSDKTKNIYQKALLRERMVKQKRKEIIERLKRLRDIKSSDGLIGEDLRIWKLWEPIQDLDKFKEAIGKNRVRFQLGQRDRFIVGIYHSGRYLKEMEQIFRDEGLPVELTRIPFVESSFNIRARSRVGASGIWQFMPRTARSYLKMNFAVDERNDPLKATRASARLLKTNYALLQNWPLAVTGYNHGPNGVRSIANKLKTQNLVEIIDVYSSRKFGFASENFYACFLAALDAERNAQLHFGEIKWGPPVEAFTVKLQKPLAYATLVVFFDGDRVATDLANSHIQSRVQKGRMNIPAGSFVRVPRSRAKLAIEMQSQKSGSLPLKQLFEEIRAIPLQPESLPATYEKSL